MVNALKKMKQWLCGECMSLHALSIGCKHEEGGLVQAPSKIEQEENSFIHGISRPETSGLADITGSSQTKGFITGDQDIDFQLNGAMLKGMFSRSVLTVKSIPPQCRLAFTRIYKEALQDVINNPNSTARWVKLLVLPMCILQVMRPTDRFSKRSSNRNALQQERILQNIHVWKEENGAYRLIQRIMEQEDLQATKKESANKIRQCKRKIADGHLNAAMKILTSGGLAPQDAQTSDILQSKHPGACKPRVPIPSNVPPLVVGVDIVLESIKAFPKGTSCGRDGFRAQHIMDMLCGVGSVVAEELIGNLTSCVNLFLGGKCPSELAELVASAPLTPLLKPDGGIRPIVVGCIWRRLVSRSAMKVVGKLLRGYLENLQFGVGVPSGGEAILHSVNRFVEANGKEDSKSMLLVDFQNAFNLVDRSVMLEEVNLRCPALSPWVEFCYKQPSCLFFGGDTLESAQGIQQGDPLGHLLFALVLHPLLNKIEVECSLDMQCWYLDDGTLIGDTLEVAKAFQIIQLEGPRLGLILNVSKTELYWPTVDGKIDSLGLFHKDISRPINGVKLLGGGVSDDIEFLNALTKKRAIKSKLLTETVKELKDPQLELILLRACIGVSKLYFALRTCVPSGFLDAEEVFDASMRDSLEHVITGGCSGFGDLQFRLASLPIRYGGLGTLTVQDARQFAYLASHLQSSELQTRILRGANIGKGQGFEFALKNFQEVITECEGLTMALEGSVPPKKLMKSMADSYFKAIVGTLPTEYSLDVRQKAVLTCLQAPHAQDYLYTLPIAGLGQTMDAREYRAVLSYRLLVPMFIGGQVCHGCNKSLMDEMGDHAVHCRYDPGLKHRHDIVRDGLADILRRVGIAATKEAPVSLSKEGYDRILRPADVLIYNWTQGRHTCVDLSGCSPLVSLDRNGFDVGNAMRILVKNKYVKHEEACHSAGYEFVPFGFTTFGGLNEEAVGLMERVERIAHQHLLGYKSTKFVFHRIGFFIQKGVAAQLVSRLPINFVDDNIF